MQSKNLRLILTNQHDNGYVSASSEALPARYTQVSARARPWRSSGLGEQIITTDLPGAEYLDAVVLYRHNLSGTATVRLELMNGTKGVVYDSGEVASNKELTPLGKFQFGIDPWGATKLDAIPIGQVAFWIPRTPADSYRITINDAENPDGYIEVGRIIAGEAFSPKFNAAYGLELTWREASEHRRTEGGSLRTVGNGNLSRQLPIDLDFIDKYDRRQLTDELLRIGKRGDVYVSVFPETGGLDEAEYAFMGRRDNDYAHTHDFYANWKSQLTFVEV